jgi:streptogramin lyase
MHRTLCHAALIAAATFCAFPTVVSAQAPSAYECAAKPTTEGRLFLKYSGAPSMRLFGVAIAGEDLMYVVGGDAAAVGVDGYVSRVNARGEESRLVDFKTRFVGPGIAVDPAGNLYLAGGDSVFRITGDGAVEVLRSDFQGAIGIALDRSGNLFVADHREGKVFRVTPSGERTVFVDYHVKPGTFLVGGIGFDREFERLYVYEAASKTLWRYAVAPDGSAGEPETVMANAPMMISIDVDAEGNVYGADFATGEIVKIDPAGKLTRVTEHCRLNRPIGFRLGIRGFHPGSAFVAEAAGILQVDLTHLVAP